MIQEGALESEEKKLRLLDAELTRWGSFAAAPPGLVDQVVELYAERDRLRFREAFVCPADGFRG